MAEPFREGTGWAIRVRAKGQSIYRSGFANKTEAKKAADDLVVELRNGDQPSLLGPQRTSVAQALSDYALEVLPGHKGADQEARRINRFLRALDLPILRVEKVSSALETVKASMRSQKREERAVHYRVWFETERERSIPNSLRAHRAKLDAEGLGSETLRSVLARTMVAVERERARVARCNTFELMARTWHRQAQKDHLWSAGYASKVIRHMELHVFPWIGGRPMAAVLPTELVRCLHRIKERGHLETAQRVREAVVHVFQYAVDVGALEPAKNFVNSKTGGLPAPRTRHYAAITDPEQFGKLLRAIQAYNGNVITRAALQLSPMLSNDADLGSCGWRTGRMSTSRERCGAARRRR